MSFIVPDPKDPEDVDNYAFDWSTWLNEGETIVNYELSAPDGITVADDSENAGIITYWLSGGEVGERYPIKCKIVTSDNRTKVRRMIVQVQQM